MAVTGTSSFTEAGARSQLTARVTLSDGTTEDRTNTATWQSDNTTVASVSSQGIVTVLASGDTSITATVSDVRGALPITVRIARRTADPAAGQRIPLPDVRAFTQQAANARPDLLAQSCPTGLKYQNNPWLDYMVDQLRTLDTRWGYNGKPTKTAADNGGQPVIAAGDEVAFHYGAGTGSEFAGRLPDRSARRPLRPDAAPDLSRVHRRGARLLDRRRPAALSAVTTSAVDLARQQLWKRPHELMYVVDLCAR